MHPILLESPIKPHSHLPVPNAPFPYDSILKESIDRFLIDIRTGSCNFSAFKSVFSRLIQSAFDPPLEIVWFYAAVIYHQSIASKRHVLDRIVAVRDLLQLIIACSAPSHGPKSVAAVAPVVAEIYHLMVEVEEMSGGGCGKEAGKERKELERLVEGVMGYVSICSVKSLGGAGCADLLPCFSEVIRVWTQKHGGDGPETGRFFPLLSDDICARFYLGRHGVENLAVLVAVQAFLLRVLVKLGVGCEQKSELQSELTSWVVGMVTAFGSLKCFEVLLKLLLDLKLPALSPSSPKYETILSQILYDSILLVEYAFLCPSEIDKDRNSLKHITLLRLVLFHQAIQVARLKGDNRKAIAYTDAFSRSYLPSKLVQWTNIEFGTSKHAQPNTLTPQSLIKWLLSLQKQGFKVLEDDILRYCEKLSFGDHDPEIAGDKADSQIPNEDFFFFDIKGDVDNDMAEEDEVELTGDAFLSAARAMKFERNSSKKRKGAKRQEELARTKSVKYKPHDATAKEYFSVLAKDDGSSGSEVEIPFPYEKAEEMKE